MDDHDLLRLQRKLEDIARQLRWNGHVLEAQEIDGYIRDVESERRSFSPFPSMRIRKLLTTLDLMDGHLDGPMDWVGPFDF